MRLKVLLLALVLAISFAGVFMPEAKAEGPTVTPNANVLMWNGFHMVDKYASTTGKSDSDLVMDLTPQGSFGLTGAANGVFVNFSGMFRTPGGGNDAANRDESVQLYLFLAYFTYKFSEVNMTAGLTFTPYDIVDGNNTLCQTPLGGWSMQLAFAYFDAARYQLKFDYMGLYVDFIKNSKNETAGWDVTLPMIGVGYVNGNPGTPMSFQVHGFYQTSKVDDAALATDGASLVSYGVSGGFGLNMAPVSVMVTGIYGVNAGDAGLFGAGGWAAVDGDKFSDSTVMGGWGSVAYTMGAAKLSAGIGYKQIDNDLWDNADPSMEYYVACKYSVTPNFAITPGIQIQDGMKNAAKVKQGKQTSIGFLMEAHI
jgi:hypothetical protein